MTRRKWTRDEILHINMVRGAPSPDVAALLGLSAYDVAYLGKIATSTEAFLQREVANRIAGRRLRRTKPDTQHDPNIRARYAKIKRRMAQYPRMTLTQAARHEGVDRSTLYRWRKIFG